jgi:hypothetical protein
MSLSRALSPERARQVTGFFHWVDWLREAASSAGKEIVFINLDETSLSRSWPLVAGNVMGRGRWLRAHLAPKVKAARKDYRGAITAAALCTHRADIQKVLPQLYIGNGTVLPAEHFETFTTAHPNGPVHFWRRQSSWNSVAGMVGILQVLRDFLKPFEKVQPVLVFDAAPIHIHIHREVLREAVRCNIWPLRVPASMTWLLQPLDTHVLWHYKRFLRTQYRRMRAQSEAGFEAWMRYCGEAQSSSSTRSLWARAFMADGLLGGRHDLSKELVAQVGGQWPVASSPVAQVTEGLLAALSLVGSRTSRAEAANC